MQAYPSGPPSVQPPSGTSQCVSRVQLNISCKNLIDKDVMSKSDPLAVVMLLKESWVEVGKTAGGVSAGRYTMYVLLSAFDMSFFFKVS